MARPREFDIEEALDSAMQVFWAKGYEATSLPDLLAAMGIARGSLYKAFTDKRSIYLAALDRYDRTAVAEAAAMLQERGRGDGADRIRRLLKSAADAVALRNDRRGCLLCNAAVDQAPADPEAAVKVLAMMKRLERAIEAALADSRKAARWPAAKRAAGARVLTNAYMGLRVLARGGYPAAELEAIVSAAIEPYRAGRRGAA